MPDYRYPNPFPIGPIIGIILAVVFGCIVLSMV